MTQEEKIYSRLAPSFLPATAVLEMTYNCNHNCIFCSCPWTVKDGNFEIQPELSISQWKETILKLCKMGVSSLAFTGGEPLLKKGIEEIINYAGNCTVEHIETINGSLVSEHKPPKLYLLSNGKVMTDEILELCKKFDIHLGLSLPGITSFEGHTGEKYPANITQWFEKTRKNGISTHAGITVTKKNLNELYETMAECLLAGADRILLNRFLPGGRGLLYKEELSLSKDEVIKMLEIAEDVLKTANRNGNLGTEIPLCITDLSRYTQLKIGTQCSAAVDFMAVDPSGYIRVCNHSPVRLNHITEINKLKDNPYWKRFVLKNYLPEGCSGCKVLGGCDAGCREAAHILYGACDSPDPLLYEN